MILTIKLTKTDTLMKNGNYFKLSEEQSGVLRVFNLIKQKSFENQLRQIFSCEKVKENIYVYVFQCPLFWKQLILVSSRRWHVVWNISTRTKEKELKRSLMNINFLRIRKSDKISIIWLEKWVISKTLCLYTQLMKDVINLCSSRCGIFTLKIR